jgi:hypothetical protein
MIIAPWEAGVAVLIFGVVLFVALMIITKRGQ